MTATTFVPFSRAQLRHVDNSALALARGDNGIPHPLFHAAELAHAQEKIEAWSGYQPSTLRSLASLAAELDVGHILYKDEGERFGLGSFKALGGAYAVSELALNRSDGIEQITVATATDGNHGLSVAWGAKNHGMQAVIYIHAEVSQGREQALLNLGAEVIRVEGNYDESVRICYAAAEKNDWHIISDTTSGDAGHDVARKVMTGYSVMVAEIVAQITDELPTHVFVQGGVGGLAATVCEYFRIAYGDQTPKFIVVEPELAPCLYLSAEAEQATAVDVVEETVMAGLSCGKVSSVAWPVLFHYANDFLTIPDTLVAPTMTILADPFGDDDSIVAGESAVAGLAGFIAATQCEKLKRILNLQPDSRVLVIGTEGATDPVLYQSLTGLSAHSVRNTKAKRDLS
jgi:diaminopropionate ammonia-lyase